MSGSWYGTILSFVAALLLAGPAAAADDGAERCPRFIAWDNLRPVPASHAPMAHAQNEVAITFVGHATFLIESPSGVTIATDYNDLVRPDVTPDIATMNRAHRTHFSTSPDPGIAHLLPGWGGEGEPARHDIEVGDVWLRNITTNIRGGMGATVRDQNSIFVFEVAGLCIAHLGHLHHTLSEAHLDALGRIDVVLAPVDGSFTLDSAGMLEVLRALQAPVVIPMHFFGQHSLERFLTMMAGEDYDIVRSDTPRIMLARSDLPRRPTVLVLPGR
jgi:L-ascorbate metabolism protein UlaG (beta-lactamase superfamily)